MKIQHLRDLLAAVAVICLLGGVVPAKGSGSRPALQEDESDSERIARWVQQLDDDRYQVRRSATERLIEAGRPAIQPVVDALPNASLEMITRGIFVLRELAVCGHEETEEQATQALQAVADMRATAAARRAAESLAMLDGIRQSRAMRELRELGANIVAINEALGVPNAAEYLSIEIGEEWQGDAADLRRLDWLDDIQQLTLEGPRITDAYLEPLRSMDRLTFLVIRKASITNDGLARLSRLTNLERLDLMYLEIGDDALDHLQGLAGLRLVRMFGTKVTPDGASRLGRSLVNAEIDRRNGAFLGVRCQQPPALCEITQVTINSAAEAAGVLPGDTIVVFDGEEIPDFSILRDLIAAHRPGDEVDMQVARGGRLVSKNITHGANETLGLEGEPHPLGLRVTRVDPDSLADRAGIEVGSFVYRYQTSERVRRLQDIERLFSVNQPGDIVLLEYLHDVELVDMTITFGEWQE